MVCSTGFTGSLIELALAGLANSFKYFEISVHLPIQFQIESECINLGVSIIAK